MKQYQVAFGNNTFELEQHVYMWMKEGFVPIGGVAVCIDDIKLNGTGAMAQVMAKRFYQAMIKE